MLTPSHREDCRDGWIPLAQALKDHSRAAVSRTAHPGSGTESANTQKASMRHQSVAQKVHTKGRSGQWSGNQKQGWPLSARALRRRAAAWVVCGARPSLDTRHFSPGDSLRVHSELQAAVVDHSTIHLTSVALSECKVSSQLRALTVQSKF